LPTNQLGQNSHTARLLNPKVHKLYLTTGTCVEIASKGCSAFVVAVCCQVCYAGACYTDCQVVNSGQRRPRMQGVLDTSLFPGQPFS